MKRLFLAAALAAVSAPTLAADVGVSISIGQPGFYGHLDVSDYPQPQVIYRNPVAAHRLPKNRPPIYLHVPSDHARNWSQHCNEYNACGERVLFVRDNWYEREYVPRYRERHNENREGRRDERGDDRSDRGGDRNNHKGHDR
jgi:hypothetical protein